LNGENPESILKFWFGAEDSIKGINEEKKGLWWTKDDDTDAEILRRFEQISRRLASGDLDHWQRDPEGLLASIICLDQFARNMHRGSPRSFASDPRALELAEKMVNSQWDRELGPLQRIFAYLPFEHSESMDNQRKMVQLVAKLRNSVDEEVRDIFDGFYDYAVRHLEVIQRFGRFPHRNTILGRESTDEELSFLEQPDSSF
jgi:uncharacterized protein (DUF924 family)